MLTYSLYDIAFCFLLYGFVGWTAEVVYRSVRDRRFVSHGLLNLPFQVSGGLSFALLLPVMQSLNERYVPQFIAAFAVYAVTEILAGAILRRTGRLPRPETETAFTGARKSLVKILSCVAGFFLIYYIVHPVLMAVVSILPAWLAHIAVWAGIALLAADLAGVLYAAGGRGLPGPGETARARTRRLAERITRRVWRCLERAYPGITEERRDAEAGVGSGAGVGVGTVAEAGAAAGGPFIFAKGLCADKIIWVFLVSALMGDIIETVYCGLVNGRWMNRSSVLYGPFSFVWGIGAAVLTVMLRLLKGRPNLFIFAAGFLIGGAYEYMCSVFTERVFGTVFWDYSKIPLNIGGRTNVLFCFFWGLLAVAWVRVLYPSLSRCIEKIPPLAGKVMTWVIVFVMVCNALLTAAAMVRYDTRQERPEANGVMEAFIDERYDDDYMKARWPNMKMPGP